MGHSKIILIRSGFIRIPWALIINPRNPISERKKKAFREFGE